MQASSRKCTPLPSHNDHRGGVAKRLLPFLIESFRSEDEDDI